MDHVLAHALALLKDAESWEWPETQRIQESGAQGGKFKAITAKLLSLLIVESQKFGGTLLDQFWLQLGSCHRSLKQNIEILKSAPFDSSEQSSDLLFDGLDRKKVNFEPVLKMAAEYFTHLGIAFVNPGGLKSRPDTAFSVSDVVGKESDELIWLAKEDKAFGKRKQEILKALSFKRDGTTCPLTGVNFKPFDPFGFGPVLAHVVPHSVHGKPDTLKCIAMFAGDAARDMVAFHLNDIGNATNIQQDAHSTYDNLEWGIEAKETNGEVTYIFRTIPYRSQPGLGLIRFKDGDEIHFGQGLDGEKLKKGPLALLCNLQLAVSRVFKMSGAADIIFAWKDEADDSDFPRVFIASEEFCDILDAKLFLSGQALHSHSF